MFESNSNLLFFYTPEFIQRLYIHYSYGALSVVLSLRYLMKEIYCDLISALLNVSVEGIIKLLVVKT